MSVHLGHVGPQLPGNGRARRPAGEAQVGDKALHSPGQDVDRRTIALTHFEGEAVEQGHARVRCWVHFEYPRPG